MSCSDRLNSRHAATRERNFEHEIAIAGPICGASRARKGKDTSKYSTRVGEGSQ